MPETTRGEMRKLYWKEIQKALQRIGETSLDAMTWVLRFVQQEEGALSEGDWTNLQYEIAYLARFGVPQPGSLKGAKFLPSSDWSKHLSEKEIEGIPVNITSEQVKNMTERPSKEAVKELRTLSREYVEDLLVNKKAAVKLSGKIIRYVSYDPARDQVDTWTSGNVQDAFFSTLVDLFALHGNRLNRCLDCKRIFLANRSDQRFCGKKCQSRAGTERFRKSPTIKDPMRKKGGRK